MVASRDIRAGEVIFEEMPLTFGPSDNSRPVCLGCYQVRSDVCMLVKIFFGENVPFKRTIHTYRVVTLIGDVFTCGGSSQVYKCPMFHH